MDKIAASKELLTVYGILNSVVGELSESYSIFNNSYETLSDEKVYKGQATGEINAYFQSQMAHIAKLIDFYQVAGQFVMGYLVKMQFTDDELKQLISFFSDSSENN